MAFITLTEKIISSGSSWLVISLQVTPALSLHYASRILQRSSRVHLKLSEAESSLELYRLSALRASLLPFLPAQNFKEVTLHLKQFLAQKGTRNQ